MENINLSNYDALAHTHSCYVLTSPRSLQACHNLGIKPVELLPRSFESFRKTQMAVGLQREVLHSVYEECEAQRKEKVHRARKERNRLMREDMKLQLSSIAGTATESRVLSRSSSIGHQKPTQSSSAFANSVTETDSRILGNSFSTGHQKSISTANFSIGDSVSLPVKDKRILTALLRKKIELEKQQELCTATQRLWDSEICRDEHKQKHTHEIKKEKTQERHQIGKLQEQDEKMQLGFNIEKHTRASENREIVNQIKLLTQKMKNRLEQSKFEKSRREAECKMRIEQELLETNLETKYSEVESRLHLLACQRKQEIERSVEKRKQREQLRRITAEKVETELKEWQKSVDELTRYNMTKAVETSQQTLTEKINNLKERRETRELKHLNTMKRLKDEEKEQRRHATQRIARKKQRVDEWMKERNEKIAQSVETAHLSARLRETIMESYLRNSFKHMSMEAELRALWERGCEKRTANRSKGEREDNSFL